MNGQLARAAGEREAGGSKQLSSPWRALRSSIRRTAWLRRARGRSPSFTACSMVSTITSSRSRVVVDIRRSQPALRQATAVSAASFAVAEPSFPVSIRAASV